MKDFLHFWLEILRSGFSRKLPDDPISGVRSGSHGVNLGLMQPYLRRHWKKGFAGVIAILIIALLAFPVPLITRFLVDDVMLGKHLEWLIWGVLALAGVKGLSIAASMAEKYVFGRFQMDITLDLQHTLLDHTLHLPKSFFDDKEVGYLMSRMVSDVEGLNWFFSQTIAYFLSNIISFIGGIVFLFILEWRLALVNLVVLPLLIVSGNAFSKHMRVLSHHSMEQHANVYTRFQETLSSIPLIKSFVSREHESKRVILEVQSAQRISLEETVVGSVANSVFNLVPDIAKAIVLIAGAYWVIRGDWTLGSLLAFQSYLGFVYGPALSLADTNLELQNALAALNRVSALMDVVPENTPGSGKQVEHLNGEIQFNNVSFSYNKADNVLENISFHIKPGEHIAIVGPSGVGKTTLISLLLRFYCPIKGEILYNNLSASEYNLDSLRRRIGYVSQVTLLMEGTIDMNLRYGNQNVSSEEMERAVRTAGIYDFIMNLPDKYDSAVGEKGVNLSEGQKQRLSIARALIKDPDILIMDEPTSALDSLVEKSIFDELPEEVRGKTLLIAAHRLSTIQKADRVMVLKDSQLLGIGTHQELIKSNDYYRSLFS